MEQEDVTEQTKWKMSKTHGTDKRKPKPRLTTTPPLGEEEEQRNETPDVSISKGSEEGTARFGRVLGAACSVVPLCKRRATQSCTQLHATDVEEDEATIGAGTYSSDVEMTECREWSESWQEEARDFEAMLADTVPDTIFDGEPLTSTHPDTIADGQPDEIPRQPRLEHFRPFWWQETTEVEGLTAELVFPTLQWAASTQEKRMERLLVQSLTDAVNATTQASGSNWEWRVHTRLWAAPQIILRVPIDEADDEGDAGKANVTRQVVERCKYPEAGNWETPAREARNDKEQRTRRVRETAEQSESQSEEAAQPKKAQSVVRKTTSGNMRGATQTLTGEGVAEGSERTAAAIRKLVMEDPAPADTSFDEGMVKAKKALECAGTIRITARMVTRRLRASKIWAAPCGSGWRNSHLATLAEAEGGVGWLKGVDPAVGAKRHQQCCGPVGARSTHTATLAWRKIRTVALTEALLKLAEGVMIDAVFNRLATIFKAQQFSVRTPGGAKAVIGALPQRSTKDPRGARVVTDFHQCIRMHVKAVRPPGGPKPLPTNAGDTVHAVGKEAVPQRGCKHVQDGSAGMWSEEHGKEHLLRILRSASLYTKRSAKRSTGLKKDAMRRKTGDGETESVVLR